LKDFQPDYFSSITNISDINVNCKDFLVTRIIESNYPNIGKIIKIGKFDSLEINSQNMKIVSEGGEFVFKLWDENKFKRISETTRILRHLNNDGICVPIPIKTYNGMDFIKTGKSIASIFTYIDGQIFSPSIEDMPSYFEAVSDLFISLKEIKVKKSRKMPFTIDPIQVRDSLNKTLLKKDFWTDNKLTKEFSILSEIQVSILADLERFKTLKSKTVQYSHNDLHPKNIIVSNKFGYGFLDFESCSILDPNVSWGFSLIKVLRQAISGSEQVIFPEILGEDALVQIRGTLFAKQLNVESLPIYGRYEIARRLTYIFDDYLQNNSKIWFNMLPIQIQLLKESYLMFKIT